MYLFVRAVCGCGCGCVRACYRCRSLNLQDYHLVRRSEISDCSVIRMSPHLATAVRRDYLLHGAERAEQRHISRESSVASMKSQWGQRVSDSTKNCVTGRETSAFGIEI